VLTAEVEHLLRFGDAANRQTGEHQVWAELLKTGTAVGAGVVRIDQTADANKVTCFEIADGRTDLGDPSDNLVARHACATK
jgi:hypothetical protein